MTETTTTNTRSGWGVTLYMPVDPAVAATPEAAVDEFLQRTLRYGLRQFTYTVQNLADGNVFVVENGEAFTEDEYLARREADGDNAGS